MPRCRHGIPRRTLIPESVLISQQAQRLRKGHPEWVWEGYGLGIKFRRVIGKRADVKQSREECSTRREESLDQNPEELQHFKVGSGEDASKENAKGATREGRKETREQAVEVEEVGHRHVLGVGREASRRREVDGRVRLWKPLASLADPITAGGDPSRLE